MLSHSNCIPYLISHSPNCFLGIMMLIQSNLSTKTTHLGTGNFGPCREFGCFQRLFSITGITLVPIRLAVVESWVALWRPFVDDTYFYLQPISALLQLISSLLHFHVKFHGNALTICYIFYYGKLSRQVYYIITNKIAVEDDSCGPTLSLVNLVSSATRVTQNFM